MCWSSSAQYPASACADENKWNFNPKYLLYLQCLIDHFGASGTFQESVAHQHTGAAVAPGPLPVSF